MKKLSTLTAGLLAMVVSNSVFAQVAGQGVAQIASNATTGINAVGDAAQAFCWVMSILVLCGACFKMWQHAKDGDRHPIRTPMIMFVVAALFAAIPMVQGSSIATIWGSGAVTQSKHSSTGGLFN